MKSGGRQNKAFFSFHYICDDPSISNPQKAAENRTTKKEQTISTHSLDQHYKFAATQRQKNHALCGRNCCNCRHCVAAYNGKKATTLIEAFKIKLHADFRDTQHICFSFEFQIQFFFRKCFEYLNTTFPRDVFVVVIVNPVTSLHPSHNHLFKKKIVRGLDLIKKELWPNIALRSSKMNLKKAHTPWSMVHSII